jgi:YjbE family integral membrane protein
MDIASAAFWAALGSIILANVLLSGDNAVVIALAARSLPPPLQKKAIVIGSAAAIAMRIVLTLLAVKLLTLPYLKLVGGAALVYIGVSLLLEEGDEGDLGAEGGHATLLSAVRTILVADLVMSLDNVLAVAAAAKNNTTLLVLGLGISIPLIVFGSTLLLKVMERFPIIITLGAGLLGFLAGEMVMTDPGMESAWGVQPEWLVNAAGALGAVLVVGLGAVLRARATRQRADA